tara:strand:+ start:332 stop:541 length:210 start_codon:yes stop_codon:yes gene_type:complete
MPPLRERVARYMWQYLKENNQELEKKICPAEMYDMADIAVKLTMQEVDAMLLEQMKSKLEKLVNDPPSP